MSNGFHVQGSLVPHTRPLAASSSGSDRTRKSSRPTRCSYSITRRQSRPRCYWLSHRSSTMCRVSQSIRGPPNRLYVKSRVRLGPSVSHTERHKSTRNTGPLCRVNVDCACTLMPSGSLGEPKYLFTHRQDFAGHVRATTPTPADNLLQTQLTLCRHDDI